MKYDDDNDQKHVDFGAMNAVELEEFFTKTESDIIMNRICRECPYRSFVIDNNDIDIIVNARHRIGDINETIE